MTEFEGVTYASCGTSCADLPSQNVGQSSEKPNKMPRGLFRNCREVMDLLQDEEETNSLLELKEESEVPSTSSLNKTKRNNVEPPLVEEEEELTLDRAMQLASLRERDDPEADDLFHRLCSAHYSQNQTFFHSARSNSSYINYDTHIFPTNRRSFN